MAQPLFIGFSWDCFSKSRKTFYIALGLVSKLDHSFLNDLLKSDGFLKLFQIAFILPLNWCKNTKKQCKCW
jgi:hypothetical protein